MDQIIEEKLLCAWMDMALNIRGNRIVSSLSFNEIIVCNILYRNKCSGEPLLTATDIGNHTKLLKSQLNKVLTTMEEKKLIERTRSDSDKRKVCLQLREDHMDIYFKEHEKVMQLVRGVCDKLGEDKVITLSALLTEAVAAVDDIQQALI